MVFVQYAGDFLATYQEIKISSIERYYAQKYSVEYVEQLSIKDWDVGIVTCYTDTEYENTLSPHLRIIGLGFNKKKFNIKKIILALERLKPDRLIVCFPRREIFKWAVKKKIRTIAILADSFESTGINKLRNWRLAKILNSLTVELVFNHGATAYESTKRLGVITSKIKAWDWPALFNPKDHPVRSLNKTSRPFKILYIGHRTKQKGFFDLIKAFQDLKKKYPDNYLLYLAGIESSTSLGSDIECLGPVPHHNILDLIKSSDIVIVPSRKTSPEGVPMVIYEALTARTPIVVSDHMNFKELFEDRKEVLFFPSGNHKILSEKIYQLLNNEKMYETLSINSKSAWEKIQVKDRWGDLISAWLKS